MATEKSFQEIVFHMIRVQQVLQLILQLFLKNMWFLFTSSFFYIVMSWAGRVSNQCVACPGSREVTLKKVAVVKVSRATKNDMVIVVKSTYLSSVQEVVYIQHPI